jgi:sugar lactone lactonase YvrE
MILVASVAGVRAATSSVTLTAARQIGGSGHAGLYAWGTATFSDGSILVGDYLNYQVVHYAKDGTFLGTLVPRSSAHGAPYGLAVDTRNDNFYMGDVDSGAKVDKYDSSGHLLLTFGGPKEFVYPSYIAVSSAGLVAVADARGNKVAIHDSSGNLVRTFGSPGSAPGQFQTPRGIAFDGQDRLFVIDTNNHRVQVFDLNGNFLFSWNVPSGSYRGLAIDKTNGWLYLVQDSSSLVFKYDLSGNLLTQWGGFGSGNGQFIGGGRDVTVDGDGNVWVGDMPDFRIQKFTSGGAFLLVEPNPAVPPPAGGFNQPDDVALDAAGDIFVIDTYNWRVEKFAPDGTFLLQWGNRGPGQFGFNYPRGIAVDRNDGSVIVADTDGASLQKYTNTGAFLWSVSNTVKARSLVVGPDGRIYVADGQHQKVVVFSSAGAQLSTFGSNGTGNGQFLSDDGIAIDSDGSLWVSDSMRKIVQHFSNSGSYLGQFGSAGSSDSTFAAPAGIAVDASFVYVADRAANKIKVWTKAGTFVAVFGGGGSSLGQLSTPQGLTLGPDGHIYVSESQNERVQDFAVQTS